MQTDILFSEYSQLLKIRRVRTRGVVRDEIFDPVRQKFLVLQPEEIVRQLVVQHLHLSCEIPFAWMRTEYGIEVNERQKRCDIVVFDKQIKPKLIVECKRPSVDISQATFFQIATYNSVLKVPFLLLTNGKQAFCGEILSDAENTGGGIFFQYLQKIPNFEELNSK